MYFGRDVDDAFEFVSRQHAGMVKDLDADTRARAFQPAGQHGQSSD
jgi:hypothetical protein